MKKLYNDLSTTDEYKQTQGKKFNNTITIHK